jgi:addiction module HigA family antidote
MTGALTGQGSRESEYWRSRITMADIEPRYQPTEVSPPGATLLDVLEEREMNQRELAERMGRPIKTISGIVNGKVAITPETALQFERVLGTPAQFWTQREATYREYLARGQEGVQLEAYADWLDELPLPELRKHGGVSRSRDRSQIVREVLAFFAVASPDEWRQVYTAPQAHFRRHQPDRCDPAAIALWMRLGELEAQKQECRPYNRDRFIAALGEIRALTVELPEVFQPRMTELCANAGVSLAFIPAIPRARVSGLTRWLSKDKALIQLSLLGKYNDRLWFTFFHEACHVAYHGKRMVFLEFDGGDESPEEVAANQFAADLLIPPHQANRLQFLGADKGNVIAYADELGIHPGIVVGRMQHEGLLSHTHLNKLKTRFEWEENAP